MDAFYSEVEINDEILFSDFTVHYLEISRLSLAPTTIKEYERVINKNLLPIFGKMRLNSIRPTHVQGFVNMLSGGYWGGNSKDGSLKPSSVIRYYAVLSSVFSCAYRLELITSNPASKDKIRLPSLVGTQHTDILSKDQLMAMLVALDKEPLQFQVLIHLAIITGCRRGELTSLQWSDVDIDNSIIYIKKSLYQLTGESAKVKSTKTGKNRTIAIPDYCSDMLVQLRTEQHIRKSRLGDLWNGQENNFLFTKADGSVMHPNTPTEFFNDFLARHNLPHIKFHALRHTSATLMLLTGANIKQVAARLGHSQLSTTNRYVHAIQEVDRTLADSMGTTVMDLKRNAKSAMPHNDSYRFTST